MMNNPLMKDGRRQCSHCFAADAMQWEGPVQTGLCQACYDIMMPPRSRHACCDQMVEIKGCVCMRARKCPVHGERHEGTHD